MDGAWIRLLHVIYYTQLGVDEDIEIIRETCDELKLLLHLRLSSTLRRTFLILSSPRRLYQISCLCYLARARGILDPGQVGWRRGIVHSSWASLEPLEAVFDAKLHMA
jgi:hypothetical protein